MLCIADFAAKKRAFSANRLSDFLRQDFELRLRIREILLPVISFRQLHPDIRNQRRRRVTS